MRTSKNSAILVLRNYIYLLGEVGVLGVGGVGIDYCRELEGEEGYDEYEGCAEELRRIQLYPL
jgi:hypothetical protein